MLLGRGASSEVILANRGEEMRAVKRVTVKPGEGVSVCVLREARLLDKLRHPNIVTLHGIRVRDGVANLELEFLPLPLRVLMVEPMTMQATHAYARQLFAALAFCHNRHIMHRDVKPENIMLARTGRLKLADFGLAREIFSCHNQTDSGNYTPQMVTLWYRAPEVLLGHPYGPNVDIWSAGCVIAEMLAGAPLFCAPTEIGMLHAINGEDTHRMTPDEACLLPFETPVKTLLQSCLDHPTRRITAEQALQSHWFGAVTGKRHRVAGEDSTHD